MHKQTLYFVTCLLITGVLAGCATPPKTLSPQDQAKSQAQLAQAEQAYRKGDYKAARAGFEAVLAASPEHSEARFRLGNIALRTGDLAQAREYYLAVLERRPRHLKARYNLGVAYLSEAEAQFSHYTATAPEEAQDKRLLRLLGAMERFSSPNTAQASEPLDGLVEMLPAPEPAK